MREHRQHALAHLLLKAVHHAEDDDERGHPQANAQHRHAGNEGDEAVAATGATGPFTVCFPDTGSLTLWHYEDGAWVDMTWRDFDGSGNPIPDGLSRTGHSGEVCGKTLHFSPFAAAPAKAAVGTCARRFVILIC